MCFKLYPHFATKAWRAYYLIDLLGSRSMYGELYQRIDFPGPSHAPKRDLIRTPAAERRSCAKAKESISTDPVPAPAQQKEATRRRAHGAPLRGLADSYNAGITTIRCVTQAV